MLTTLQRVKARLGTNFVPRVLRKIRLLKPIEVGSIRPASMDYSMAVPFRYEPELPSALSVAVICHMFYVDLAPYLLDVVSRVGGFDALYISTDTDDKKAQLEAMLARSSHYGTVVVKVTPNRGRDIAPKLIPFREAYEKHDIVLFLHTKKSTYDDFGRNWLESIVDAIAGSEAVVRSILDVFEYRFDIGMIIPQHYEDFRNKNWIDWGVNFRRSQRLAAWMGIRILIDQHTEFAAGSMFWARTAALRPLLDLNLQLGDFQPENGQRDGTTAHAVERLFLYACEKAGFTWCKVACANAYSSQDTIVSICTRADIDKFVANHRFSLLEPLEKHHA